MVVPKTHIFPRDSKKAFCGAHVYDTGSIGQYNEWATEKTIKSASVVYKNKRYSLMCKKCVKIWRKKKRGKR